MTLSTRFGRATTTTIPWERSTTTITEFTADTTNHPRKVTITSPRKLTVTGCTELLSTKLISPVITITICNLPLKGQYSCYYMPFDRVGCFDLFFRFPRPTTPYDWKIFPRGGQDDSDHRLWITPSTDVGDSWSNGHMRFNKDSGSDYEQITDGPDTKIPGDRWASNQDDWHRRRDHMRFNEVDGSNENYDYDYYNNEIKTNNYWDTIGDLSSSEREVSFKIANRETNN